MSAGTAPGEPPLGSPVEEPPVRLSRYELNALIGIGFIILFLVWWHRHMTMYFHQRAALWIAGGVPTLLLIWGWVKPMITSTFGDRLSRIIRSVLGRRPMTGILVALFLIALLLLFVTSSVHLTYAADYSAAEDVRIKVRSGDQPFASLPTLRISRQGRRYAGKPFFFASEQLVFETIFPLGTEPLGIRPLKWHSRIAFEYPTDFPKKHLHLAYLVPSPSLLTMLPAQTVAATTFYLSITPPSPATTVLHDDLRRQIIVIGAGPHDLPETIPATDATEIKKEFSSASPGYDSQDIDRALQELTKNFRGLATGDFRANDNIQIEIGRFEETPTGRQRVPIKTTTHHITGVSATIILLEGGAQ